MENMLEMPFTRKKGFVSRALSIPIHRDKEEETSQHSQDGHADELNGEVE